MKNILITTSSFDYLNDNLIAPVSSKGYQIQFNPFKRKLTVDEVSEMIDRYDPVGIIAGLEPLTQSVMQKAKKLKVISRCGIGLDSVDLEAARDRNITVTNTPDGPTRSVAELCIGLMISLLRRIHSSNEAIRRGQWDRPIGSLLYQKTIGILGCGRIGTCVAGILSGFECRVIGYDIQHRDNHASYARVSMEDLLNQSDILTLHLSYSPATHHIIDRGKIRLMKNGSFLINTARGALVDETALYEALESGYLGGAALDTFEEEPYQGPMRDLDNVLLTAHIGSYAKEARMMMEKQAWDNLFNELRKKEAGY